VEALWDRGVEAHGIDVSPFAISQVRRDTQRYCVQGSIVQPLKGRYDLVTCIEVLEHLMPEEAEGAITNLAAVTDTILFAWSPSDLTEPTHFNVQPPIRWLNQFVAVGFLPDCTFDASFVAPHAILLRRHAPPREDLLLLFCEKIRLKSALTERDQRIGGFNQKITELTAADERLNTAAEQRHVEINHLNALANQSQVEIVQLKAAAEQR